MQSIKCMLINWINEIITVRDENNRIKGSMSLLYVKSIFKPNYNVFIRAGV